MALTTGRRRDRLLQDMLACASEEIAHGRRGEALATLKGVAFIMETDAGDNLCPGLGASVRTVSAGSAPALDPAAWRRRMMSCPDCGAPPGALHDVACDAEGCPF
ncbi:MAG TPA: hypothetical protein VG013_16220 [Gemmataceae bacterium]|jgi:hypothetical protein|nr:hypothetical protein [Gemmataceae bacterium]